MMPVATLAERVSQYVARYGPAAKFATKVVLGTCVPGGAVVAELVGAAIDCARETAEGTVDVRMERLRDAAAEDLDKVGRLLDLLTTKFDPLLTAATHLEDRPERAEQAVRAALARDERLTESVRQVRELAQGFTRLEAQNDRLLAGQGDLISSVGTVKAILLASLGADGLLVELHAKVARVDERLAILDKFLPAVEKLSAGQARQAVADLDELTRTAPPLAELEVTSATAAAVDRDLSAAEAHLTKAARLAPARRDLADLQAGLTRFLTRGTNPGVGDTRQTRPTGDAGPRVGDHLHDWRLVRLLGRGGFGSVFLAERDGRRGAIKVLNPDLSHDRVFQQRFREEMKILIRLGDQPGLVGVLDFEKTDAGLWYFVMPYLDGQSLADRLRTDGPLDEATAMEGLTQLATGLAAVHRAGLIHRDIKPSNIMIERVVEGGVARDVWWLIDFGIAIETTPTARTAHLSNPHTAAFAAPEQLRGRPATPASDLYSLAATVYYALAYDAPDHRAPETFNPDRAGRLATLLEPALHANPLKRPSSATALISTPDVSFGRSMFAGPIVGRPWEITELAMKFIWCPPGSFTMGSPANEAGRLVGETPHRVTLTKGFWLGRTEVTQAQWTAVMGTEPWRGEDCIHIQEGPDFPATYISWEDAVMFCRKLTDGEQSAGGLPPGTEYHLPTEARWEYACRAGTTTAYSFGDDTAKLGEYAWYGADDNWEMATPEEEHAAHRVGTKKPNPWDLYDMHGNVDEWCSDWHGAYPWTSVTDPTGPPEGAFRVCRGGCWAGAAENARSACRGGYRNGYRPNIRLASVGFRVALVTSDS